MQGNNIKGNIITLIGGIVVVAIVIYGIVATTKQEEVSFQPGDTLKVASTIFPLHDIVRTVAGDKAETSLMLPPGASPHLYEFTPSKIRELVGTHLIFSIGYGIDEWTHDVEDALPGAHTVTVDSGITLRETAEEHEDDEEEEHHDEDEHDHVHGPVDPHYWLTYRNAKIITENVAKALSGIDPDNSTVYEQNAQNYIAALSEAERTAKNKLALLTDAAMITLHDAWYYFADDLGLEVVGTFEPSGGEEPTPRYLAELIEAVEEHGVTVLFSEPQIASSGLQSFARDNGLTIAVLDPIGGVEERTNFISLMDYNVNEILNALTQ